MLLELVPTLRERETLYGSYLLILLWCREQKDQEHAAKMAQRLKEEEEIQKALRLQDEITAKKMHEAEARK